MKIYRNGIEIELTSDEIHQAYREQELLYRTEDAKNAVEYFCGDDPEYKEIPFDYELIAQRFIDRYDCDRAENDQFYEIVREYIDDYEEFKEGEAE